MPDKVLEQKFQEVLQKLQKVIIEQITSSFSDYASAFHSGTESLAEKTDVDGMGQMQEAELSEDMMAVCKFKRMCI